MEGSAQHLRRAADHPTIEHCLTHGSSRIPCARSGSHRTEAVPKNFHISLAFTRPLVYYASHTIC